jgi:hypothetical protein
MSDEVNNQPTAPEKKEWTVPSLKKSDVAENTANTPGSATDGTGSDFIP